MPEENMKCRPDSVLRESDEGRRRWMVNADDGHSEGPSTIIRVCFKEDINCAM
jgi:hypothetical protein